MTLHSQEEQDFYDTRLEGLAWCVLWLMAPELGNGPFLKCVADPLERLMDAPTGRMTFAVILGRRLDPAAVIP